MPDSYLPAVNLDNGKTVAFWRISIVYTAAICPETVIVGKNCMAGKHLVFVMNRWMSSAGGIQTVNRELCCAISRLQGAYQCWCIATTATSDERRDAEAKGVHLIAGDREDEWAQVLLSHEVSELVGRDVTAVIGHSRFSGESAALLRERILPGAALVHFVHTTPIDTEGWKEYRQDSYVTEREERVRAELAHAKDADLVACIGPRIARYMKDQLRALDRISAVVRLDCGIHSSAPERTIPEQPTVLFIGRTDSMMVKGLDIFAYAAGYLQQVWSQNFATRNRPAPRFVVRGAKGQMEQLEKTLITLSDEVCPGARIVVRPYTADLGEIQRDYLTASMVMLPSREEGFGLVACEALSLAIPVVLSRESGIAEVVDQTTRANLLDRGKCLVETRGPAKEIGRAFAAAAMEVFEDESLGAQRFYKLREFLRLSSSWDTAARQLTNRLVQWERDRPEKKGNDASSSSSAALGTASEREDDGSAQMGKGTSPPSTAQNEVAKPEAAIDVLKRHEEDLRKLPGVLAVGVKQAIVVIVEKGYQPPVPSRLDGVDIVVRTVDGISFSSLPPIAPGDRVYAGGAMRCTAGPLVIDSAGRVSVVTSAHGVAGAKQDLSIVTREGTKVAARLDVIDAASDLATLRLEPASVPGLVVKVGQPELGLPIRVFASTHALAGTISGTAVTLRVPPFDGPELRGQMFELQMSDAVPLGSSGALVVRDDDGQPLGVVAAQVRGRSDEGEAVFAVPLGSFLARHGLNVWGLRPPGPRKRTVGILLSIPGAWQPLARHLTNIEREVVGSRSYWKGLVTDNPDLEVRVAVLQQRGNLEAAVTGTQLLSDYGLDLLLLVGTAASVSAEASLGDVVIGTSVLYYEPGRAEIGGFVPRYRVLHAVGENVLRLAGSHDVSTQLVGTQRPDGDSGRAPHIVLGMVASGEKDFFSTPEVPDGLRDWSGVVALEMEAAGVAQAYQQANQRIPFLAVLGISDFAAQDKVDSWQGYALDAACTAAIEVSQVATQYHQRVWHAVRSLPSVRLVRLKNFARWRVRWLGRKALGRNEDDLISEAIVATAEGHRVWKPDVDFFQHMLGAVRSISSSWRETRGEEYLESELAQEEGGSPFEQRGTTEDPERILSAVERLEQVRKLFARDAAASQVIELLGLGHTAKEIQSQLHMSPRDFGATAKRIRRRLGQWLGAEG